MTRLWAAIAMFAIAPAAIARGLSTPQIIDDVYLTKEKDAAVLLLHIDRPWSEFSEFKSALAEKLNAYATFVANDQLIRVVPETKGLPVRIIVFVEYEPSGEGIAFLDSYKPALRERGILLQWHVSRNAKKAL